MKMPAVSVAPVHRFKYLPRDAVQILLLADDRNASARRGQDNAGVSLLREPDRLTDIPVPEQ